MQIKTFNEILTEICDDFDNLITPKTIARTNTNIIYLMFKAIAKGYEVIHNLVVALHNKYNPAYCSDEDLESTAMLVGTERLRGSYTGLEIVVINNKDTSVTLLAGEYVYELDEDTKFKFTVKEDTDIGVSQTASFIALTDIVGRFPVTAQASIEVTADVDIDADVSFSCTDNYSLLGTKEETSLEFRKRILSDTSRQDVISELELKLKNLPYIFDCSIFFNETLEVVTVGDVTIPPYYMLILLSGEPRSEIARIVAESGIYPTVEVNPDNFVEYENSVFASGSYKVYYGLFSAYEYTANIIYTADENFITPSVAEERMFSFLITAMSGNTRKPEVTENDIYNALEELNLEGVKILSVELYVGTNRVPYVSVPDDKIAKLISVSFGDGD